MTASERVMLIRRGNELYQQKDYKNALKIYLAVQDKEGITKIAYVLENEKKDPLTALKLYKQAGVQEKVDHIAREMAQIVRHLIKEDKMQEAVQKGEDFNYGYKVSGQSPSLSPSEALRQAKRRLGITPKKIPPNDIIKWQPQIINREELED